VAIGTAAVATNANDVALGSNSVTSATVPTSGVTLLGTAYTYAGATPTAALSVGGRQIQNVAAGQVTAASTDGINGSQLYATDQAVEAATTTANGAVQYGKNPDGSINLSSVPLAGPISTNGGVTGGTTISNVAQGALSPTSTDAVNGSQLNATNTSVSNVGAGVASVAAGLGGGASYNPTTGVSTAPSYTTYNANGTTSTVSNVGDALASINSQGIRYFHANSTGADSQATGMDSVAIGSGAVASNANDVALGSNSTTSATVATSGATIGGTAYTYAGATPTAALSVGGRQIQNVAAGQVSATSTDGVNGSQLYATDQAVAAAATAADNSVQYDNAGKTSVTLGGVGSTTPVTLTNVANGTSNLDAVNVSQLTPIAGFFGGGSSFLNGSWTAPAYAIQGTTYNNVGDALHAVDSNISNLYSEIANFPPGPIGPVGPPGPPGAPGTGSGSDPNAVQYDNADKSSVTLGGAGATAPVTLHNVAAGTAPTDAVNVQQLSASTQQAINQANTYTDASTKSAISAANAYTNQQVSGLNDRFNNVDNRISQTCAMGTAMTQMAMAGAGAGEGGRVAAGVGVCSGGASAVSAGYATPIGDRGHINFGAAFSGGQATVGAGVGIDLH
jgi:autotransporter adhesin